MAPAFLLALSLFAQGAPAAAVTPAEAPFPVGAPTDDYGFTAWCYGAVGGYIDLYDKVMPEVERIERTWPSPSGVDASLKVYPQLRDQGKGDLKLFASAIEAAERASPTVIAEQGKAGIAKGRGIWTGAATSDKAKLAQAWMGWTPPARCAPTAKRLQAKASLFGKALDANNPKPQ